MIFIFGGINLHLFPYI